MRQCTLYIDIENLPDINKQIIANTVNDWPVDFPKPDALKLYVKADQTDLWKIWADNEIPSVETTVRGVQHYCFSGSKNSADIILSLDVIVDLLKERTKKVAILSDDSDYVSLFTTIKREINMTGNDEIPFKWLMTDRSDTRSTILADFFPDKYVHVINTKSGTHPAIKINEQKQNIDSKTSQEEEIALAIIQDIPVGIFKSSDCKKIISRYFPDSPMRNQDSASFGNHFSKNIWPFLQKYGVQLPNPNKKPRKYEMTEEAKKKLN